ARPLYTRDGRRDEVRVHADRGDRWEGGVARIGTDRLGGKGSDLPRRVLTLERRQVHHPDRELEREDLRVPLDRTPRQRRGALFQRDSVDGPDTRKAWLE